MFKRLLLAATVILGLTGVSFAENLQKEVFNTSVRLEAFCSGTIIHSDRDKLSGKVSTIVLTAKHCVMDKNIGDVLNVNKFVYNDRLRQIKTDSYVATYEGASYKSDLAVLKLKDEQTLFEDVATVGKADIPLAFGDPVVSVGYPLGLSQTYTLGNLGFVETQTAFNRVSSTNEFFRATPDIAPGSSGGSLFTLKDGKYQLIGVVTGGAPQFSFFNYFTPVEEINEYLDVYGKDWVERKKEVVE